MTFRKAAWLYLLAAGLVVLGVSLLPSPRDRNPPIPGDPDHRVLASDTDCLRCHVIGQSRPLPDRHPKRRDCARCHRRAQPDEAGRAAPLQAARVLAVAGGGGGVAPPMWGWLCLGGACCGAGRGPRVTLQGARPPPRRGSSTPTR